MVSTRMTEAPKSEYHTCAALVAPGQSLQVPLSNLRSPPLGHGPLRMSMKKGTFWPNGTHIKVGFMGDTATSKDASDFVKAKVQEKAKIWEQYANIVFDFVDMSQTPDVRVAFGPDTGSWSYIGTECQSIDVNSPTMNYGWFNDQTADDEFERVAVHEFGHALGCAHELQSPNASTIIWNKEAVYQYYQQNDGWDQAQVDAQVLTPDNPDTDIDTMFDPTSIMCYPIPPGLANIQIGWNKHLSPIDEDFIGSVYPKQTHDAGAFSTDDLANRHPPNNINALQVKFSAPYKAVPSFAYGLSSINMSAAHNIRILASIDNISMNNFEVHADTWNDSQLYSASVSWMETVDPSRFQVGSFDTKDYSSPEKPLSKVTQHIQFSHAFTSAPTVLLFLKGVDLSKAHDWQITPLVLKTSPSGFDVTVEAGGSTQCFGAQLTWVAFPSFLPAVCGGTINASDTSTLQRSGQVSFPKGKFSKGAPPSRVVLALNSLNFKHGKDLRIKAYADNITVDGFTWHAESWSDSLFVAAGLSWLAL